MGAREGRVALVTGDDQLSGLHVLVNNACRLMVPHGQGVVVNITSVHEHQPRPGDVARAAGVAVLTGP